MILPKIPEPGAPIDDNWGRQIVACLRALRIINTPTARVCTTPDGQAIKTPVQIRGRSQMTEPPPFTVYPSPDATGTAAWRTVRVHAGTINDKNPRTKGDDSFSDDTDLNSDGTAKAHDMDMVLDAQTDYFVVLVQTRKTSDWSVDKTYLFFVEDETPGTDPFDG